MAIRILITGGTIDNLEHDSEEDAPKSHESLIPGLFKQARVTKCSIDVLMSKDSKFITDEDRASILNSCADCKEDKIVITHGTMTMPETAKYLARRGLQKTIVLTGAAIPGNEVNSDALFNLGAAITAVQLLPAGVYITMNGEIFSSDNVRKDLDTGFFETEH